MHYFNTYNGIDQLNKCNIVLTLFDSPCRGLDPKQSRLLPVEKVKPLLEKTLNREFQSNEWKYMVSVVGISDDGLLPYENIIAVINNR